MKIFFSLRVFDIAQKVEMERWRKENREDSSPQEGDACKQERYLRGPIDN
jgi:hypothetical protein